MTGHADLHDELRTVARQLLSADMDGDRRWAAMADAGWLGLEIPEELGGSGASFAETAVTVEELGRAATASPYLGTAVLGVATLLAADPSPGRDDLLRRIAAGEATTAVSVAPHADTLVADPPFVVDGDGVLSGRSEFVIDAPSADHLLLFADRVDADTGTRSPVVVSVAPDRLDVADTPLVDATRSAGSVTAAGVVVDPDAIWPLAGDPATVAQLVADRGATAMALDGLGIGRAMLDATVAYVGDRHQFGRPIGSFQAVKHRCADMAVALEVAGALVDDAVAAVASPDGCPSAAVEVAVSRAASYVGAAAVDVAGGAMQLHGGIGYTWDSGIHVYLKRAVLDRALFGSPAAHRRRVAAHLVAPAESPA